MSLTSREKVDSSFVGVTSDVEPDKELTLGTASRDAVEVLGRREFFRLRQRWSRWIVGWITVLILFNIVLTVAVGIRAVDYSGMQWFITAVTVETFLQIVGMGYVAVKFLFSKG